MSRVEPCSNRFEARPPRGAPLARGRSIGGLIGGGGEYSAGADNFFGDDGVDAIFAALDSLGKHRHKQPMVHLTSERPNKHVGKSYNVYNKHA
eukprot:4200966-Pyramimonas_sp.AAC.1